MESSFWKDDKSVKIYSKARKFVAKGDYIKALEIIEDLILAHRKTDDAYFLHDEQASIFLKLARRTEDPDVKFAYTLALVECFSGDEVSSRPCALGLFKLAEQIGSALYYKKCVEKAIQGLSLDHPEDADSVALTSLKELHDEMNTSLEDLIKDAESKIAVSKTTSIKYCEPKVVESKKSPNPVTDEFKGLSSYWLGLDVNIKREFMKVSIEELKSFVEGVHKRKGRDALDEILASAKADKKWIFWMCRTTCIKKFSSAEDCKTHFEQVHTADFKPSPEQDVVKRIGKDWTRKISVGGWEALDAVAAVEMIKDQLAYVKAFASKSKYGWSKKWPSAVDEERSKLLKEIKVLLVSFCDHKILSCSIRDWVMRFPAKHLGKLQVSEQSLIDSRIVETPQSICFLECQELNQILDFLKNIKCERHDGIELVCRAVDSFVGRTRVKEMIDFDPEFSLVLLDRRLLKSSYAPFGDEGTISCFDPNVHYAKAHAQGDYFISWLADYSSVDKISPRPIREHNLDIWAAVMKAVQFTCRTLGTKYAKKAQVLEYEAALTEVENLCMSEDERRSNLQEDQWNRYSSLLCQRCNEKFHEISFSANQLFCTVRDILEGASYPTFDFPDLEGCMNLVNGHKSPTDNIVLESIRLLKPAVTKKVMLIDSKILLIDNSRIRLLNNLSRLSVFDNRTYMLRLLKPFLLKKLKSDAAKAELLFKEEKLKKSQTKKKNNKKNKETSTSLSSPLDKNVEHEPSANLEPEDTLASDDQEEATKVDSDMQNMPGGHSLSEHLESALGRALDMTLKALLNIEVLKEDLKQNEQPFHDDQEEQVPLALQEIFTAFKSDVIEGVYSFLLSDLLASLKEVISMPSDAAEVLVTILEYSHCWKNSERESLVTRLFTLEENERMSCRKCRRKPNYPEQISDGIVMAADSIRDLKCAFGNIKFVDIIKLARLGCQMLCDIKTGGCGETNFVHYILSRCPPIITIVLEWEKSETEKEIYETTKALEWEIDISRLYEGLEPNTTYRLVSMVGCGEEDEHICIAYGNNRWVNLIHDSLAEEDVGNWESVVRFCEERKVRPEILFYETARSMA